MKATPKIFISLMTIFIVLISYSCQKDNIEGELSNDPEFIESLYTNASDTVNIDNQDLILETEIYRDFFPGGPINNKDSRLVATIWIVNIDSTSINQNLSISKLYVINSNQVWVSGPETNPDNLYPEYELYLSSKDGPKWETGIAVDVVISITDLTNNKEKLLIDRNQIIEKVE